MAEYASAIANKAENSLLYFRATVPSKGGTVRECFELIREENGGGPEWVSAAIQLIGHEMPICRAGGRRGASTTAKTATAALPLRRRRRCLPGATMAVTIAATPGGGGCDSGGGGGVFGDDGDYDWVMVLAVVVMVPN